MIKRTMTGIVITAVVYFIIAFSHIPQVMLCATAALSAAAVQEIFNATGKCQNKGQKYGCAIAAIVLTFLPIPQYERLLYILFPVSVALFGWMMARQQHCTYDKVWKTVMTALAVVLLFQAIPQLRQVENGLYYLLMAVTLCFVTDVAAYLIGSRFGKHKLIPKVSPNKTWEGSIAGIAASVLTMLLFGWWWKANGMGSCMHLILYAVTASVVSQFGDLAMSAVKRIGGVKDFGSFLPGHGGILDRFDSHLFCIAYTLLFCIFTGGYLV